MEQWPAVCRYLFFFALYSFGNDVSLDKGIAGRVLRGTDLLYSPLFCWLSSMCCPMYFSAPNCVVVYFL